MVRDVVVSDVQDLNLQAATHAQATDRWDSQEPTAVFSKKSDWSRRRSIAVTAGRRSSRRGCQPLSHGHEDVNGRRGGQTAEANNRRRAGN